MANSIKQAIQRVSEPTVPAIVVGTVTGVEPIEVTLVEDLHVILSNASLIIPSRISNLVVGDAIYLLSFNKNKMYYVLDRM